jgi:predicted nuclease of predicted toxin-antitoxin system
LPKSSLGVIRFHLDQHVSNAIARGLRARGMDVSTTAEAGLQDAPDDEQLAYILDVNRVIFTQDDDFLRIHSSAQEHPGIIYSKQGTRTVGEIIRFLQLVNDCLDPEDMRNRVEYF